MEIKVHNGVISAPENNQTIFYIQSKGNNAGRPLLSPITNCWEVKTFRSVDFEILYIIFESRILEPFIGGSVIPFIRLHDYKNIIKPILNNAINEDNKVNEKYLQIRKIETQIKKQEEIKYLLLQLKSTISKEVLKTIKKHLL
ncbi:hypothetical protein IW16_06095 [Chryseobacterium vrystaatense]|uniref:Type I restriction modification DNA specificity domain-containing protein n=2 Tax=Chryseobacterium vrystaatense TaxID=307480 RepID=A0ABR4UP10_9FLAO|nr:hypothetical protein IW16_06095 [Chryseobacterium vrystaatense]